MRCKREQFWWWFRSSLLVLSRLTIDVVGFLSGSGSKYAIKLEPVLHQFGHPTSQQEDILSSSLNGCDHLQNSLVSLLNKLQRMTVERDGSFPVSGRSFSATSGHAPRIWEQRILLIFSRFWYLILFTFIYVFFLAFKFGWVVNNTFFFSVTNSEHI